MGTRDGTVDILKAGERWHCGNAKTRDSESIEALFVALIMTQDRERQK